MGIQPNTYEACLAMSLSAIEKHCDAAEIEFQRINAGEEVAELFARLKDIRDEIWRER